MSRSNVFTVKDLELELGNRGWKRYMKYNIRFELELVDDDDDDDEKKDATLPIVLKKRDLKMGTEWVLLDGFQASIRDEV